MTKEKADKSTTAKSTIKAATIKAEPEAVEAEQEQAEQAQASVAADDRASQDSSSQDSADGSGEDRAAAARAVVDKYAKWSFAVGFIPVPGVDLLALTGTHMKMLHEIAKVYGQSYSNNKVRSTLSALISGSFPQTVGRAGVSSLLKGIPVLGTAISMMTMPVTAAACTYAVGTVFVKHFESGGNLLSLDLSAMTTQVKGVAAKYKKDKTTDAQSADTEVTAQANEQVNPA
ncbi:MAG: DUF697 domain-containing protein [Algicola sp.]|nr:DUF697 domain-containing protein [Algicola sp.]